MRTTDDTQATVALDPVKQQGQAVSVGLYLQLRLPQPPQDEQLPAAIEAQVYRAGPKAQRALFRALIEHAETQLVLALRHGSGGRAGVH